MSRLLKVVQELMRNIGIVEGNRGGWKDTHSDGCYKSLKLIKEEILGGIGGMCNWSDHTEPHHITVRQ